MLTCELCNYTCVRLYKCRKSSGRRTKTITAFRIKSKRRADIECICTHARLDYSLGLFEAHEGGTIVVIIPESPMS
jgi:hypothetical protein